MKTKLIFLGIFLLNQTYALAHSGQKNLGANSSDQKIVLEVLLPISVQEAWKQWTEPQELQNWLTQKANIEPKIDGLYELFWEPDHPTQNSTIGCKIIEFEINKLLSFQWKGPVPFADIMNAEPLPTWVTVNFIKISENKTVVRLEHFGFGKSKHWQEARDWQQNAWSLALTELRNKMTLSEPIFKRYEYPNGEVLELTKSEFDRVVEVFRMLDAQDQRLARQRKQQLSSNID
jgi:uncharacterized protein YndB with AHSA1/START domain